MGMSEGESIVPKPEESIEGAELLAARRFPPKRLELVREINGLRPLKAVPEPGNGQELMRRLGEEVFVKIPDRWQEVGFETNGIKTEVVKMPAFGQEEVLSLAESSEKSKPESDRFIVLPGLEPVPKYFKHRMFAYVSREAVFGSPYENLGYGQLQERWAGMIEQIDDLVKNGRDGRKLRTLDQIGGLYVMRLTLMALIKGKNVEELEEWQKLADEEREEYAPIKGREFDVVVDDVQEFDGWYLFGQQGLVAAPGNGHSPGLICDKDAEGNLEILLNFEDSAQADRNRVVLPGGGIEMKDGVLENPVEALRREAKEELAAVLAEPENYERALIREGEVFMQMPELFEETVLVAVNLGRKVMKDGKGDELGKIEGVTSDLLPGEWKELAAFEEELLAGHITDARAAAAVYLAMLEEKTTEWGLVLENPREVIARMRDEEVWRDVGKVGSLGSFAENQVAREKGVYSRKMAESQEGWRTAQKYAENDAREFVRKYGLDDAEAVWVEAALSEYAQNVTRVWESGSELGEGVDEAARAQHWGYVAGMVGRKNGLSGAQMMQLGERLTVVGSEQERRQVYAEVGVGVEEDWWCEDVSETTIKRSASGAGVWGVVEQFAERLGVDRRELERVFLSDGDEGVDNKVKDLLDGKGNEKMRKIVDLAGRVAHLGWMVGVMSERRWVKFDTDAEMFGTFGMMKEAVLAGDQKEGWETILKDYDQVRVGMKRADAEMARE